MDELTRRGFLRLAGATGAAFLSSRALGQAGENPPSSPSVEPRAIPRRPLGRTGMNIPILGLGGMFDTRSAQLLLRQSLAWGVSFWDTADCYENGNSEEGFGRYFQRSPADRDRVFLVTKSDDVDPDGMSRILDQSLRRMQTSRIDLFLMHGIKTEKSLSPAIRRWADENKAAGRIRLFGFSTHRHMEPLLEAAAASGFVDAVMASVNYRLLGQREMERALDSCSKAGVGVIAMKFKGGSPSSASADVEARLDALLRKRGFTREQAKLKALWDHPSIASICAGISRFDTLKEYAAAALDTPRLSDVEREALRLHADATRGGFCRACGDCETITRAPVPDAMRCLMYENAYGDARRAAEAWARIPADARARLALCDVSAAEHACPNGLPVARLILDARRRYGA